MPASTRAGWGWHCLAEQWAERIVGDARIARGDLVLDVGAGTGAVTEALTRVGARVIAVELHPRRAHYLRERFAADRVTVVRADAGDLRLPRRPFKVVANPPFGVTTQLLRRLLVRHSQLVSAHLVLQHAAARRWADGRAPGAARWARDYDVRVGRRVPRAAFSPPPAVDASMLEIRRR